MKYKMFTFHIKPYTLTIQNHKNGILVTITTKSVDYKVRFGVTPDGKAYTLYEFQWIEMHNNNDEDEDDDARPVGDDIYNGEDYYNLGLGDPIDDESSSLDSDYDSKFHRGACILMENIDGGSIGDEETIDLSYAVYNLLECLLTDLVSDSYDSWLPSARYYKVKDNELICVNNESSSYVLPEDTTDWNPRTHFT